MQGVELDHDKYSAYLNQHLFAADAGVQAFKAAADPSRWPEHGDAWQAAKLYYHMGFHRRRYAALEQLMHEHGIESQQRVPIRDEDPFSDGRLTTFIECSDYFEVRDAHTLLAPAPQARELVVLTAARLGKARLIDNLRITRH